MAELGHAIRRLESLRAVQDLSSLTEIKIELARVRVHLAQHMVSDGLGQQPDYLDLAASRIRFL